MKKYLLFNLIIYMLISCRILTAEDIPKNITVIKASLPLPNSSTMIDGWSLEFKMEEVENGFSRYKKRVFLFVGEKNQMIWKEYLVYPNHESKKMVLTYNEYSIGDGEISNYVFDKDKFSFKIKKYIYFTDSKKAPFEYFIQIVGNIKKESQIIYDSVSSFSTITSSGDLDIKGICTYIGPTNPEEKTEIEWKLIDKIIMPYQEVE